MRLLVAHLQQPLWSIQAQKASSDFVRSDDCINFAQLPLCIIQAIYSIMTPNCFLFPTRLVGLVGIIVTLRHSTIQMANVGLPIVPLTVNLLAQIGTIHFGFPSEDGFHAPSVVFHFAQQVRVVPFGCEVVIVAPMFDGKEVQSVEVLCWEI